MSDRGKVIEGLENAKNVIENWIPMFEQYNSPAVIDEAITLLKKIEPVRPLYTTTSHPFHVGILYHCGNCHCSLNRDKDLFCSHCGKPIDWEKGAVKWE